MDCCLAGVENAGVVLVDGWCPLFLDSSDGLWVGLRMDETAELRDGCTSER